MHVYRQRKVYGSPFATLPCIRRSLQSPNTKESATKKASFAEAILTKPAPPTREQRLAKLRQFDMKGLPNKYNTIFSLITPYVPEEEEEEEDEPKDEKKPKARKRRNHQKKKKPPADFVAEITSDGFQIAKLALRFQINLLVLGAVLH